MLCSLLLLALLASAQGRAVNISNTWVLPEEGFPVFYRYFRDRISWYEADAVCQFHHANLVTVDTTAQYDAVRAYLKELDISSAVWVGLIRSNPDGDFTWTDYRGLSGDGYWSSAPDARSAPLCAAADPAADYRWEARACGGPTVASFICELPVPQWALGNEGCMVRALPALTVLYLPESAAVQLTADCGMAGVKRVQCTGNVKREELLKDLSCTDDDETSQPTVSSTVTAAVTTDGDQETNEVTTEEIIATEHENDPLYSITSTPDLFKHISIAQNKLFSNQQPTQTQNIKVLSKNNINLDVTLHNNLQSNDIPKIVTHNDFYSNELMEKQEDEKHILHKLLHDELARLGNFENIFSQPTDHFVPPLVMAKAKVNDDMTAVSFEEKLAQQHTEYLMSKNLNENNDTLSTDTNKDLKTTTAGSSISVTSEMPQTNTFKILKDKKEINKHILPKKYDQKLKEVKNKVQPIKFIKYIKSTTMSPQTEITNSVTDATNVKNIVHFDPTNEDSSLDLTVIIKEPVLKNDSQLITFNFSDNLNDAYTTMPNNERIKETSKNYEQNTESNLLSNVTLNDEIIKITFVQDGENSTSSLSIFEVTTKMPIFKDNTDSISYTTTVQGSTSFEKTDESAISTNNLISTNLKDDITTTPNVEMEEALNITNMDYRFHSSNTNLQQSPELITKINNGEGTTERHITEEKHDVNVTITSTQITPELNGKDSVNNVTESVNVDDLERNLTDTSQYIDDFQSPLLSGANEPLHKPNRSRRPQQPANRIKKFNPFRILG